MTCRVSPRELAGRLAERIERLVPELLPCARCSGGYWTVGNAEGDAGNSLYIHRSGYKLSRWTDTATGQFGDLLDLINAALFGGHDLREAIRWASAWLGLDGWGPRPPILSRKARPKPHRHDGDEADIAAARNLWSPGQPLPGTPGERYLRIARAYNGELPPTLRYSPALNYYPTGTPLPALIAAISGPDQKVTAVQRIYRRLDGLGKAGVADPKLTLGRTRDGACRLAPTGRELGLSEGIETGLSAMELYRIPVWAACGSRMDAIAIPEGVERLVIFADNGSAGVSAAERATIAHGGLDATSQSSTRRRPIRTGMT
jgi:Toprim domain